jgi:1,4-dihydroxy-2-naphthoate octaprenyltransferase
MLWAPLAILLPYPLIYPATIFAWVALLFVLPATMIVRKPQGPKDLILALKITSLASLVFAITFSFGLAPISFDS